MNEINKINSWKAPLWHEDFGNPETELSLLKKACLFINALNLSCRFELSCFEEGYMNVDVFKGDELCFEIYAVDVEKKIIGLFFADGREVYINKIEDISNYVKDELTGQSV